MTCAHFSKEAIGGAQMACVDNWNAGVFESLANQKRIKLGAPINREIKGPRFRPCASFSLLTRPPQHNCCLRALQSTTMDAELPPQASTVFADISLEDLATGDPLKQIPALHKLLFEQFNGKECSHYIDILHKVC
jgi:hypothetical protein